MTQAIVIAAQFAEFFDQAVAFAFQTCGFTARSLIKLIVQAINIGLITRQQRHHIFGTHSRQRGIVIAMQIHQALKRFLFTGAE